MVSETKVRLFPGGPEFPSEFLDFIQEGRVVFFCGAGLSAGTGLPTFPGLVRELDEILPDLANPLDANRGNHDQKLSELESRFMPGLMREHVRRILSESPRDPEGVLSPDEVLENHRNILRLAAVSGGGLRLVTTNFDDRFALANGGAIQSKDWPELPSLKDGQWESLVHLHGRIRDGGEVGDLVLTASDFAEAYFPPGELRAANFIVDLLRQWPVAFVGYGLNDPPMNYLVRAVHDAHNSSEKFQPPFALVGCSAGEEDNRRREWENKQVIPILYNNANNHESLRDVLDNLARLKDEPGYRAELAIRGVDKNPSDENGDNGRRVVWALRDSIAARGFSGKKRFPKVGDGEKFVRWLDAFKKAGLFRADKGAPIDALDCPPHSLGGAPKLPPVAERLAFWAARHAHQPGLLWWLVKSDGIPHPKFVWHLLRAVNGADRIKPKEMPDQQAEMWNLHIQECLAPPFCGTLFDDLLFVRAKLEWATLNMERQILAALRPRPRVVRDASFLSSDEPNRLRVKVAIDCEMERAHNGARHAREHVKTPEFVAAHAEALSAYLEEAASLMKRCGISTLPLRCFRPDEDDYDHRKIPHWLFLALRVRDAVLGMIKGQEFPRLGNLVSGWLASEYLLPRRLALFTITEAANSPASASHLPVDWGAKMMIERPDILWAESMRESCRFLRKAGAKVSASLLAQLERVIRKGPPRSQYRNDAADEVAKLLAKLELSGAQLSPESAHILAATRAAEPEGKFEEFMEYCGKRTGLQAGGPGMLDFPGMADKRTEPAWGDMTIKECADCIQSAERPNSYSLIKGHPDKAMDVFEILAERGAWNKSEWAQLLYNLDGNKDLPDKVAVQLLRWLELMPDELAFALERNYTRTLQVISRTQPFSKMEKAWRLAWGFDWDPSPSISGYHVDALTIAINNPHGQLAEVSLMGFNWEEEREKLLDILAEILASGKPAHEHGKIVIGSRLSRLFRNFPEWTKRHLLPFFAPDHPMAFGMWEAFLYHPGISLELLVELKPGLTRFLKCVDDFHDRSSNLVRVFVVGCQQYPGGISRNERRRMASAMNPKGIQLLCGHMEDGLWDGDGAARAKMWRERIHPFLGEVWPEKSWSADDASEISRELAGLVISTGNAFPEAVQWAKKFLWPIFKSNHPSHPVVELLHGHQREVGSIPTNFPRECMFFLGRIVPDKGMWYRDELDIVLNRIEEAKPELRKHPEFIRLRRIASGG